jgi:hypothetical protein
MMTPSRVITRKNKSQKHAEMQKVPRNKSKMCDLKKHENKENLNINSITVKLWEKGKSCCFVSGKKMTNIKKMGLVDLK